MPGIVPWSVGANFTFLITPQARSASGVFSDLAIGALSMKGRVTDTSLESTLQTENLSPTDIGQRNPVPFEAGVTFTIEELHAALPIVTQAAKGYGRSNVLRRCWGASFWHKVEIQMYDNAGTPVQQDGMVFYVLMTNFRRGTSKSSNRDSATFETIALYDETTGAIIANPALGSY